MYFIRRFLSITFWFKLAEYYEAVCACGMCERLCLYIKYVGERERKQIKKQMQRERMSSAEQGLSQAMNPQLKCAHWCQSKAQSVKHGAGFEAIEVKSQSQEETWKWGCAGSGPGDKSTIPLDKSCQHRSLSTVRMRSCHPKEIEIKRYSPKF